MLMGEIKPKIVFLQASLSQPRELKRIRSFMNAGFEVEGYAFNRGYYNVNSIVDGIKFHDIGFAKSGSNYWMKFIYARKVLRKIFLKYRLENVIYYSFSFDLTLLCKIYSGKRIMYEISDIVYGYFKNNFIHWFFKQVDKWLIKTSFLTVLTSEGFYNYLFPSKKLSNVIIQPNKLDNFFNGISRNEKMIDFNNIVFSYIGSFRYPNTVFRFARVVGENFLNHEFHFYGDSEHTETVKALSKKYENVMYQGEFKNPGDLQEIYNNVDIVVACYDTENLNERIAEPNKLYESLFFMKPIIVSSNTFVASQVHEFQCGFDIDATVDVKIIEFIKSLSNEKLEIVTSKIKNINKSQIIDDNSLKIIDYIRDN
jgi:succinoglycan biosynthesis protein ExoL